jgi:hypothetical protein
MPTAWEQAVTMHALWLAFPFLKICEDWTERIIVIEDAMHLREREHQDLIMEAARVSGRLKIELGKVRVRNFAAIRAKPQSVWG